MLHQVVGGVGRAMKLLAVAGDIHSLIADIRLVTPLQALVRAHGGSLVLRSLHDCSRADLAAADVMVLQRGASRRAFMLQQAMRQRGGAVVAEFDDLLTDLPAHISHQAALQAQRPWVQRCLVEADAVSVSTARLGRELGLVNACVVPNGAFDSANTLVPAARPDEPVSLLLVSMDHLAAPWLLPALCAVQGAGVQIVAVGPAAAGLAAAGLKVIAHPLMPRPQFIDFVRSLPNPLALIPLEDSRFAACKSAIKWFDYGEAGVPVLCSDVDPYRAVIESDVTGCLVANHSAAWEQALRRALADTAWRARMAAAARSVVRQRHTLDHTVCAWQAALAVAQLGRAGAVLASPTAGWRLQAAVLRAWEPAALRLRAFNRTRLARRQQARR